MKYLAALAAFALMGVDARVKSSYATKKVQQTRQKLERDFGKGLANLYDANGRFQHEKLSWGFRNQGRGHKWAEDKLGAISVTIMSGLTIDATLASSLILGFSNGLTYTGLQSDNDTGVVIPNQSVPLTNCFASTYALLNDFDTLFYNVSTFASIPGTIKIFDVAVLDPSHIMMDFSVEYEMCEVAAIYGQFKDMAGADYAAIADNVSREILVIMIESPETRTLIKDIKEAGECAAAAIADAGLDDLLGDVVSTVTGGDAPGENDTADEGDLFNFITDEEIEAAREAAAALAGCTDGLDKWAIGNLSGNLFSSFFDTSLMANI